jgi:hypothetical protein
MTFTVTFTVVTPGVLFLQNNSPPLFLMLESPAKFLG